MTTYYRGPRVLITDQVFYVRTTPERAYRVNELYECHVAEEAAPSSRVYGLGAAAGSIVVTVAVVPAHPTLPVVVVAVVVIMAASVLGGACLRRPARTYELCALYRGAYVCLYRSRDLTEFGQVKRGLVRALERHEYQVERTGESLFRPI